jgi:hypothetical protein
MAEKEFKCEHKYCVRKKTKPFASYKQWNKHLNNCGKDHLMCYSLFGRKDSCPTCLEYEAKLKNALGNQKENIRRANRGSSAGSKEQCRHTCGPHGARCRLWFGKSQLFVHMRNKEAHPYHQSCVSCKASEFLEKVLMCPKTSYRCCFFFFSFFFFFLNLYFGMRCTFTLSGPKTWELGTKVRRAAYRTSFF